MYDVIVVGAGPAGAAAALAARRAVPAARVLLLDKAAFPRDKACGDGIAPHAVDVLEALGVANAVAGYSPVDRLEVRAPSGRGAVRTVRRPNWVIPRRVFDARLVQAARAEGVDVQRHRVRSLEQHPHRVIVDGALAARVVVAADGANSSVRRLLGIHRNAPDHLAVAMRGYAPAPPGAAVQRIVMSATDWPSYAWSFPIGDGTANVGYGVYRSREALPGGGLVGRLEALLDEPEIDPGSLRGHHLPFSSQRPAPAVGRVLLAGDAASLINPLSGEGIYYALASGSLAGRAAVAGDARQAGRRHEAALRALLGRHFRHTSLLARVNRGRWLAEAAVVAADRSQGAFDELVELALGRGTVGPRLTAGVAKAALLSRPPLRAS